MALASGVCCGSIVTSWTLVSPFGRLSVTRPATAPPASQRVSGGAVTGTCQDFPADTDTDSPVAVPSGMPATDSFMLTLSVPDSTAVPRMSTGSARSIRATAGGVAPATVMAAAPESAATAGRDDGHSMATSTASAAATPATPASLRGRSPGGSARCPRPSADPRPDPRPDPGPRPEPRPASSGTGTREARSRSPILGEGCSSSRPGMIVTSRVDSADSSRRTDPDAADANAARTAGEMSRTGRPVRSSQPGPKALDAAATPSARRSAVAGLRSGSRASPPRSSRASASGTPAPGGGGSAAACLRRNCWNPPSVG